MEAALCLSIVPQVPSKKLHSLLTLHGSHTSTLRCRRRRRSSFSRSGLLPKLHRVVICCHAAPNLGNDNNYKKANHRDNHMPREVAVGVAAAAAAAAALACFLGVACARRAGGAGAGVSLPGMHVQQQDHPATTPPSSLPSDPTQRTLAELLQLLDDAKLKLKEFRGRMKMSDKGCAEALYKDWKKDWKKYWQKYWKSKSESKGEGSEEKYLHGLSLTDMLIGQGEYIKAKDICQELKSKSPPTDPRVPLRLAILCTMLGEKNRAKEHYEEFQEIRSVPHFEDSFQEGSLLHGMVHNFETFEMIVNNLKKEIEHSQKIKIV